MRAAAAGDCAAGCRQCLTAGLTSSPTEGQSCPHTVGVNWIPSVLLCSCQGLEQCRASAILWGQSRAQEIVQNESQAKAFGQSHFRLVEILFLMAVAPVSDLESLHPALSKHEPFLMWVYVILRIFQHSQT